MSRMEFRLFAPYLESVQLIGSWLKRAVRMKKDERGVWSVTSQLPDGTHTYKYRIKSLSHFMRGKRVEITDPLAVMVDESNGEGGVIKIEDDQIVTLAYDWQHDTVPLPQDDRLILYELHIAEFGWKDGKPGTFETVIERLDYLRDLGVNAVELMPISAFPFDKGWGYNVRHACAVENAYGTPQDLKRLVDECHARGMRVLLDIVFNHTEVESPLTRIDFYYWFRDPYENEETWGAKLDYGRRDDNLNLFPAREFSKLVALHWLREYHIDGYRIDAAADIDNDEFLREIRELCKANAGGKPFYLVAEHLPEDPGVAGPDAPTDGAWRKAFQLHVISALCESERNGVSPNCGALMDALDPCNQGYISPARTVNYVESHDETPLMGHLAECGITGDRAFRKAKLAASLLFTASGNPMLHMGQEFGSGRPKDPEIRPLEWDLLEHDYGLHLKEHYAFLGKLRLSTSALTSQNFEPLYCDLDEALFAFRRWSEDQEVGVVVNSRDEDRSFRVRFPNGRWREMTFDSEITVEDGCLEDTIPASAAKIYFRTE